VLKWVLTISSLLVLISIAVSIEWRILYIFRAKSVCLECGALSYRDFIVSVHDSSALLISKAERSWAPRGWWPRYFVRPIGRDIHLSIPLWMPLVVSAVPTIWLFWGDRRRPAPRACRCGYDLTGNTSGRCPECGGTIALARPAG
jgi:hypothetical protein